MDEEIKEIKLLDLLVVVAENIKLLILGTLVFGLLGLGFAYFLPQSFTSQAILAVPTPAQAAALLVSPVVLDPVVESLRLSEGQSIQVARDALAGRVKALVGKDGLLRLEVTASTPTEAQAIANAMIDTWLKTTAPSGQERVDLEKRLVYAKASLEAVSKFMERVTGESASDLTRPAARGEIGMSIVAIGELQARYQDQVLGIPRTLQGLSRDVVKQTPTFPTERVAPRRVSIVLWAAFAGGLVFLVCAFIREAWRAAARDPILAGKQSRFLAAIRFDDRSRRSSG